MRRKFPFAQPRHRGIVTPFCRARRETRAWVGCYRKNALGLLPRAPGDAALGHPAGIKSSFQLSLGPLKTPVSSENRAPVRAISFFISAEKLPRWAPRSGRHTT